jgi:hypothetical protein
MGPRLSFLASAGDNGFRDQKGLELQRLHGSVLNTRPLSCTVMMARWVRAVMPDRSGHGFVSPNEAQIEAHQLAEFFSHLPGSDRSLLCQELLDATLLGDELICCEGLWRDGSNVLSRSNSGAPTEHNRFKK